MATQKDNSDMEVEKKLVRHCFDLMGVADDRGYYVFLNDRWPAVLGWSLEELKARHFTDLVHPDDLSASKEATARPHVGEAVIDFENRQRTKAGDYRWIQWRLTPLLDDGRVYFSGRDVTRQKADEERLRALAMTDGLTGLFNRTYFVDRFHQEMKRAQRYERHLSLVIFDLDHFKTVNDRFGHGVGDEVLRQIAATAQHQLRETDVLARYGGEEFVVLLPELNYGEALAVAEKLRLTIRSAEVPVNGETLKCTASFGVSAMLSGDRDFQSILDRADKGLYEAKAKGRNRVIGRPAKD